MAPAILTCPPGTTLVGSVCEPPPSTPTTGVSTPGACPAGQQLVSLPGGTTRCVAPFAGFSFAIGGGPGRTEPDIFEPDDEPFCPGKQVPFVEADGTATCVDAGADDDTGDEATDALSLIDEAGSFV